MFKKWMLIVFCGCLSNALIADESLDLSSGWQKYTGTDKSWLTVAAADTAADPMATSGMAATSQKDTFVFEERMFTANKVHKYLGIGSIAAAGLTLLSPKEEDGAHEMFGRTAAALGVGALLTGLAFHYEDISLAGGLKDPDNLHALLTTLGTAGFLIAVDNAPDNHAGAGSVGGIAMAIGIKMTW